MRPHESVAAILRLRRWALDVLSGAKSSPPPSSIDSRTWQTFLAPERCASALTPHLDKHTSLPPALLELIFATAAAESRSTLLAQAQARVLMEIASRLGSPMVILKGGVRAISGLSPALPLADIDVLVERDQVEHVVTELVRAGLGTPARPTKHHHALTPADGRMAVEVHWTTNDDGRPLAPEVWSRLRPIPRGGNLMQLSARDNVEHLLRHIAIVHGDHVPALRDIVLTAFAVGECAAEDLAVVRRNIANDEFASRLNDLLEMATALASPDGVPVKDKFVRDAALFYAARILAAEPASRFLSPAATSFVVELALGRTRLRDAPARAFEFRGTGNATLAKFSERAPRIVNPVIGAAHAAYYAAAVAFSLPRLRKTAAMALAEVSRQSH